MDGIAERLREARKAAGFKRAVDAATSLGVQYQTYAGHENGNRGFDSEAAAKYARRFKVSLDWLLTGKGDGPGGVMESTVPIVGYVGAGAEVMPDFEQVPPEGLDQVTVPFPMPDDMIAFKVRGESMLPVFKDGAIIIVYREQKRPIEAFYGEEAAVRTSDGRRFIKTIMRGADGTVNLMSWNASPIENVRLEWIGEIFTIMPPSALRKVERQGGIQGQLKLKSA